MSSKSDISSRKDIEKIVQAFYSKAMEDGEIGYIFTKIARIDLAIHVPRIVDFWESVLFGSGSYKGNPVLKHVDLNRKSPLLPAHFKRWLFLWNLTVSDLYQGQVADEILSKANLMAELMMFKIEASESEGFVQ